MQDGTPWYFMLAVREHLDETLHGRWTGRKGPIPWPLRCHGLTPLDFAFTEKVYCAQHL